MYKINIIFIKPCHITLYFFTFTVYQNYHYIFFVGHVVKIGVNCPKGSVKLIGQKKCNCTEDSVDCIPERRMGKKKIK